jgi:hypothetical protein
MDFMEVLEKLKSARRQLDALQEVEILEDWKYDDSISKWFIKLQIHMETSHADIPAYSRWFLTAENHYPQGSIKFYPAAEDSLTVTFPHQANNGILADNQLWRKGALCLDISAPFFADRNLAEPFEIDERVLWYVKRAIAWIGAANDGRLQEAGAYFELPEFQVTPSRTFVFSEDYFSAMQWEDKEVDCGYADVSLHRLGDITYRVKDYLDKTMNSVHLVSWGTYFNEKETVDQKAIWIMLKQTPIVNVWQAPNTYAELIEAINAQGIAFTDILRSLSSRIRDGKRHLLLLGFLIPKIIGSDEQQVFWQALQLPFLSHGKQTASGFRAGKEPGYWYRDKTEVLKPNMTLDWLDSQNWNQAEITNRGKMDSKLLRKRIVIIGAGCIGSALAELLVRAGVYNLTIIDHDILEIGNMSRHVLNLNDIGGSKEQALSHSSSPAV